MIRVSAIFPVYYNAGSLRKTFEAVSQVLEQHGSVASYECIFVDDGSGDNSLAELLELYRDYPEKIKVVELVRNFGQVPALHAGSELADGDVILNMSADLQDPPELILQMLDIHLAKGVDIVVGSRASRDESLWRMGTSAIFYWLMRKLSFPNMPKGGFDFILFTRRVRDAILSHYEGNCFWQGKLLWSGYSIHFLSYHRREREFGQSRWTFSKKIKYLIDGVMAYSYFPLRAMAVTGLLTFLAGVLYSFWIVILYLFRDTPFKGWAPIMILILLLGGLQMLFLGVIGEYLWRTLDQVRQRPLYLIKNTHGFLTQAQIAGKRLSITANAPSANL